MNSDWFNKVAIAASVYCEMPNSNEAEIDKFLEFLYNVYGYNELMKIRKNENRNYN